MQYDDNDIYNWLQLKGNKRVSKQIFRDKIEPKLIEWGVVCTESKNNNTTLDYSGAKVRLLPNTTIRERFVPVPNDISKVVIVNNGVYLSWCNVLDYEYKADVIELVTYAPNKYFTHLIKHLTNTEGYGTALYVKNSAMKDNVIYHLVSKANKVVRFELKNNDRHFIIYNMRYRYDIPEDTLPTNTIENNIEALKLVYNDNKIKTLGSDAFSIASKIFGKKILNFMYNGKNPKIEYFRDIKGGIYYVKQHKDIYKGNIHCYDISAAYSYALSVAKIPSSDSVITEFDPERVKAFLDKHEGKYDICYFVRCKIDYIEYGVDVLPFLSDDNYNARYATDIECTLSMYLYNYMLENCYINHLQIDGVMYCKTTDSSLCKDFTTTMYKQRESDDILEKYDAKALVNAFVGGTAAHGTYDRYFVDNWEDNVSLQKVENKNPTSKFFPVHMVVSEYIMVRVLKLVQKIGIEKIIQVAVDGIITTMELPEKDGIVVGMEELEDVCGKMGKLKVEEKGTFFIKEGLGNYHLYNEGKLVRERHMGDNT